MTVLVPSPRLGTRVRNTHLDSLITARRLQTAAQLWQDAHSSVERPAAMSPALSDVPSTAGCQLQRGFGYDCCVSRL